MILIIQLTIVASIISLVISYKKIHHFFNTKCASIICLVSILIYCIIFILLTYFKKFSYRVPYNYILLYTFTLAETFILSYFCIKISPFIVLVATIAIVSICLGLSLYCFYSKSALAQEKGLSYKIGLIIYIPGGALIASLIILKY